MGLGCPTVLSKHLEVTSTHLEDQPCLVQLILSLVVSQQIPPRRMGFSFPGLQAEGKQASFSPLVSNLSSLTAISPTWTMALTFVFSSIK